MGLAQSIRAVLGKTRVERVYINDHSGGVNGKSASSLYAEQPHLRTVIDFLARNVAQLSLKCYVRAGDTDRLRDTTSALALLLQNPNPQQTRYDLIAATVCELCLYDRFIWFVGRDSCSASGYQIRLIPHDWVTTWGGSNGWDYEWLEFSNPNSPSPVVRIDTASCVIGHGYCPGSPAAGLSPVESLKQTLAEQMEAQQYRMQAWKRGMRITGYVSRPNNAPEWSNQARGRFMDQLRESWSAGGASAGGTPLLEDGMEYKAANINTKESEWSSGVQLSREDVAAAYHVNPKVIWSGNGQTYASAKDNARALYADTLGPLIVNLAERINKCLIPLVGGDPSQYVEFDIQTKMRGSFEEMASSLQTSCGGPWVSRNEARAYMNLPAIPGLDEVIVPLNVTEGGLASPTDTSPNTVRYNASEPQGAKDECGHCAKDGGRRHVARVHDEDVEAYEGAFKTFFGRQRRSVLSAMGAKAESDEWWDAERWNRELAQDLLPLIREASNAEAARTLTDLGIDPAEYDAERADAYLEALAESRARMVNDATKRDLDNAEGGEGRAEVYDKAQAVRAKALAGMVATAVTSWSTCEAGRQCGKGKATKTWITGQNPRPTHAAMNGDTVPIDGTFSNGAKWPGDSSALDVADVAGCNCTVEISVP